MHSCVCVCVCVRVYTYSGMVQKEDGQCKQDENNDTSSSLTCRVPWGQEGYYGRICGVLPAQCNILCITHTFA